MLTGGIDLSQVDHTVLFLEKYITGLAEGYWIPRSINELISTSPAAVEPELDLEGKKEDSELHKTEACTGWREKESWCRGGALMNTLLWVYLSLKA